MSEQHRWTGQNVAGRYLLGKHLGGTAHSVVFVTEIVHARAQRVAIKIVPVEGIDTDRQFARWKALSSVSHANLLKILDYGKCELDGGGHLFVVMEYADEDLADILPQRALSAEETRGMMEPVIETLAFLHERNLVHTRVHPGNILAQGDQIKLSSDSISPKGEAIGFAMANEGFSPPEWGAGPADPAEDVWSLGATVVATLTQRPPSFDESGEPALSAEMPEPFANIARESLKKDAAQRISVAGIRAKLNPASVPVVKEAARESTKIDPIAVPLSKITPPTVSERRAPISPVKPVQPNTAERKSYFLPIAVIAIVAVLLFAVPKLFRQKSDAASPAKADPGTTEVASMPKSSPSSSSANKAPKKSSPSEASLTETSQPAAPVAAPAVKTVSKPPAGTAARGEVLDQVLPDISGKARATIQGTVRLTLRLQVNATGTVDSAELDTPSSSKYFSEQAIKAAKRWQFSAPEIDGRSVPSEWLLRFEFTPSVTNVHPTQVSP
ncbi:MAG TPA: TonB family protein [Candidatus Dormibacteraeota bacterium]|nr:TonB family protein [Candidatus Dormibacteraeota bacterium]